MPTTPQFFIDLNIELQPGVDANRTGLVFRFSPVEQDHEDTEQDSLRMAPLEFFVSKPFVNQLMTELKTCLAKTLGVYEPEVYGNAYGCPKNVNSLFDCHVFVGDAARDTPGETARDRDFWTRWKHVSVEEDML